MRSLRTGVFALVVLLGSTALTTSAGGATLWRQVDVDLSASGCALTATAAWPSDWTVTHVVFGINGMEQGDKHVYAFAALGTVAGNTAELTHVFAAQPDGTVARFRAFAELWNGEPFTGTRVAGSSARGFERAPCQPVDS